MKFPLGDIARAIGGWFGRIFKHTKGVSINVGGHEIHLNEGHEGAGPSRPGESELDRRPHRPAPPPIGGRR